MTSGLALRSLTRFVVLLGLDVGFLVLAETTDAAADPLGIGLLFFAAVGAVTGVWSIVDGHKLGVRRTVLVWAITGTLLGLAMPFVVGLGEGFDRSVVLADVKTFVPFMIVLVMAPAAVGGAIGHASRPSQSTN